MPYELSPAAERVNDLVHSRRTSDERDHADLTDWLITLLADEDGKPFSLIPDAAQLHQQLLQLPRRSYPAPPNETLFRRAVEHARRLRGDVQITTDLMLIVVLQTSFTFAEEVEQLGVDVNAVVNAVLGSTPTDAEQEDPGPPLVLSVAPDRFQVARIVDANLNRSREALRVLDDYGRFIRNDRLLTETVKQLRHDLVAAAEFLPADELLSARDTLGDVGTIIAVAGEYERRSSHEVAVVNVKRLQESLRSLEEFGKTMSTQFAVSVEAIRYRAYTLEKMLHLSLRAADKLRDAKLYLLVGSGGCRHSMERVIREAAEGGVDIVQLREKNLTDSELLAKAKDVRRWTREAVVLFIVNDRPDLALAVEADGVHLGQDDLPVAVARRMLGTDAIIGVSTHDLSQVRRAVAEGADYLGVGPAFPSATKSFDGFPGLAFLQEAAAETTLPLFALGGINIGNLDDVLAYGIRRIAVAAAIGGSDEPRATSLQLHHRLQDAWNRGS